MFEKPLLQDNIWETFLKFNQTYITTRSWGLWIGGVLLVLGLCILLLRKSLRNKELYDHAFPADEFFFNKQKTADWLSLLSVIIAIILTEVYIFTAENSLFENYDLMAINTTRTMRFGLVASFDYIRLIPLASWYLSTLYAITQNILVIKSFVIFQTMLMAWAVYAFFSYIPVAKRLFMIAVFLLTPTVLQTANIIFPERDMIIFLMLSLICARKYCRTASIKWVFAFMFFANAAIYTKETCITFYFGILLTSVIYGVVSGKIEIDSFFHPIKMIKSMPLELLIGISLFGYTLIFGLLQQGNNFYLSANKQTLWSQIVNYRMEIVLIGLALGIALFRLFKYWDVKYNPLFRGGLLVGALCSALLVVVIFKLSPSTPHLYGKSYYLLASFVFVWAYLFEHISSKRLLAITGALVLLYSAYMNIQYRRQAVGTYYREVAEFMAENTYITSPNSVFIAEDDYPTKLLRQWITETWATAFRYYFNDRSFLIKSDAHFLDKSVEQKLMLYRTIPLIYFPIIPQPIPTKGDWVIMHKNNHTTKAENIRKDYKDNLVFENKLFEVYQPK